MPPDIWEKQNHLIKVRKNSLLQKIRYELFKCALMLRTMYFFHQQKIQKYDLIIDFSDILDSFIRIHTFSQPTIRWVHGQLNGGSPITAKQIKKYRSIFIKHQCVITICEQMKQIIMQNLSLPESHFKVMHNPIDLMLIRKKASEPVKLPFDVPYLLQVSRLVQGKGHETMLDIFAKLKQHGIPHKLVFIGDGNNRVSLEAKLKQLNLQEECYFLGEISNPYPYFKQASLFLHTSEHEGLPTVILESMALGVPVVAMDCPTGPKDILGANSEYGKLIAMNQQDDFVQAVLDLLYDDVLYQHYQAQSLLRIHDFSMENIGQQLENLLQAA
ncbi:glycosyltransferase [Alysiella sp.]|uniref:glycosyltransferase n=1 Tax=Alysiella sp. TaxID=1872483 RepID=UPI0026DD8AA7|nr:glycosyltransferase [Alysiella sp.]